MEIHMYFCDFHGVHFVSVRPDNSQRAVWLEAYNAGREYALLRRIGNPVETKVPLASTSSSSRSKRKATGATLPPSATLVGTAQNTKGALKALFRLEEQMICNPEFEILDIGDRTRHYATLMATKQLPSVPLPMQIFNSVAAHIARVCNRCLLDGTPVATRESACGVFEFYSKLPLLKI
jgi:hypothetical protein